MNSAAPRTGRLLRAALLLALSLRAGGCSSQAVRPEPVPAEAPSIAASAPVPAPARDRAPAETMSYLGADWLTRPERIEEEQPDRMLDALGIRPGMVVADIGAGVGYHALKIAPRVGPAGRVYATDIQQEMLQMLRASLRERRIENVVPVLSGDAKTGLPPGAIDLALMVDVYHELSEPERFLEALKLALKPRGRLVLVEFRGEDPDVPIKEEHKMTAAQVIRELGAAGFALVERHEFLPWQHILIFALRTP